MKFDKFVFWACVIDSFFIPYVWFISIPYTMVLIFYWFIKRHKSLAGGTAYKMFRIMFVIMCLSTLFGYILAPEYIYKNTVYLIQFTSIFLYYFMFSNYIKKYNFNIKSLLVLFIIFVVILAILFNIDTNMYYKFLLIWNARSGAASNDIDYLGFIGNRYTFIWMDPNNIGYMMNAVVLYLWCNEKTSFFIKVFSILSLIFVLVSCMSNGGFITLGIDIGLYLIVRVLQIFKGKLIFHNKIKLINILLFMVTIGALIYIVPKIPEYFQTSVVNDSFERMNNNSGDSRFIIWEMVIKSVNFSEYILFGKGGEILINGYSFRPHNGHFYWILGYGFISYFMFMYIFFRKRRITSLEKYIWVIPILFGFTINIMIGEIKLMGIFSLLLACSSSKLYLNNVEGVEQAK